MRKLIKIFLVLTMLAAGAVFFYSVKKTPPPTGPQPAAPLAASSTLLHYSYFSQKDFYEQAYAAANSLQPPLWKKGGEPIKAIIVNHHLLASQFIAQEFNQVATTAPITVLLISPN